MDVLHYDVVIVGGGPAGLAAALELTRRGDGLSVCLLEKSARIGGHLLSGARVDPADLRTVIPESAWKNAPTGLPVTRESLRFLTPERAWPLPWLWASPRSAPALRLIALGPFCRWLAGIAEGLGVEIYPGFAAAGLLWHNHRLEGVVTGDQGRNGQGEPGAGFQPGIEIRAPVTILAEGCRGHLSGEIIRRLGLKAGRPPQTWGLGFKELWELPDATPHHPGETLHTLGWPLDARTHGGGFLYRLADHRVALGWIVGLDYDNPHFDPFVAFQQWKGHPFIRRVLEGGRPVGFGARTVTEGGWQALPRLTFDGGLLVGDAAGFLDAARFAGIGNALRSGMSAARAVLEAFACGDLSASGLRGYPEEVKNAPWAKQLREVRNVRPGFRATRSLGLLNAAWERLCRGRSPWTLDWRLSDRKRLKPAGECLPPPLPLVVDGRLCFDRSTLLHLSALTHREDQPPHLLSADPAGTPLETTLAKQSRHAHPETRFCPAGVFRLTPRADGDGPTPRIRGANCLHCKCCDIKDPDDAIRWSPPEGGSGPDYGEM